eukprot:gnl/TRDRNA2_/TRDRNA2_136756_c0_seq1.p1 gnl/TRDRNA2_/TRDRNA2_136756_c0~~gnl/TRDRNA2_/TRDRNA2_136756_c0_seq1.p1  ORF type:complete len:345 (+),score=47.11 gnl/TRDRNA2_/TRDRNA2_136756_c0_seq1:98-1036(+)
MVEPPGAVAADGTQPEFVAEAGRYHLFVSGVCPWASGVAAARWVLGLQDVISIDVADGQSSAGWCYRKGASCEPWVGRPGSFFAHEVYQAADPLGTTRITVPILWDTKTQKIVSNDSWNIVKMLATAFAPLATPSADVPLDVKGLYPPEMAEKMEALQTRIYTNLLNGVYRAGIGLMKGATAMAEAAEADVYAALDELNTELSTKRFLLGSKLTAVDLRLAMTLLRYDSSYMDAFQLQKGKGGVLLGDSYAHLRDFTRDVYAMVAPTVVWPAFRQYYRWAPGRKEGPLPPLEPIMASAATPPPRWRIDLAAL